MIPLMLNSEDDYDYDGGLIANEEPNEDDYDNDNGD